MKTAKDFILWGLPPHPMPQPGLRIRIERGSATQCAAQRTYRDKLGWTNLSVLPAGVPGNTTRRTVTL